MPRSRWIALVSGCVITLSAGAFAQGQPDGETSTTEAEKPKPTRGVSVRDADSAQKRTAGSAFGKGMRAMEKGDGEAALEAFRESYSVVASPNSGLMIVRALAVLGRKGEAYRMGEQILTEARQEAQHDPKYTQTADAVQTEMDDLKSKMGFAKVTVTLEWPNMRLMIDGVELPQAQWGTAVPLDEGTHNIILMSDWGTEDRALTVKVGETVELDIGPPKPKEVPQPPKTEEDEASSGNVFAPRNGMETGAYVAAGVGVVGLLGLGIFGGLANSKFSTLEEGCTGAVCPAELQGDADDGATFQAAANAMAIVGAIGLLTGAGLFVASRTSDNTADAARIRVTPTPGGVVVHGAF